MPPVSENCAPADETCCALLQPIGFTSTLPVVIVNTNAQNITRTAVNSTLCTCSQGLQKGDLNTTVGFRQRGGTNSRMSLEPIEIIVARSQGCMPVDTCAMPCNQCCHSHPEIPHIHPFSRSEGYSSLHYESSLQSKPASLWQTLGMTV